MGGYDLNELDEYVQYLDSGNGFIDSSMSMLTNFVIYLLDFHKNDFQVSVKYPLYTSHSRYW